MDWKYDLPRQRKIDVTRVGEVDAYIPIGRRSVEKDTAATVSGADTPAADPSTNVISPTFG